MSRSHCILLVFVLVTLTKAYQEIQIGPQGDYSNIIVAIHRTVPENPDLVYKIKELFTKASSALHKATFGRAYFGVVSIVVPNTWGNKPEYENATEDMYEHAHFKVEGPNVLHGDEPYTIQDSNKCGEPGRYTHWTPNYLLTDYKSQIPARYGEKKEMRLVQEWARLRYGLFEEYGKPDDSQYPSFFRDENGKIQATTCTEDIRGSPNLDCPIDIFENIVDGEIAKCWFVPSPDQEEPQAASIMFTASVNGVEHFCDDTNEKKHNTKARNKHNTICPGRSTWSVIKEHEDFSSSQARRLMARNSLQKRDVENTKFRVLRTPGAADGRVVFVLDVSGSMKGRPMELLHAAASRAIRDHVPDGSKIGIVSFSSVAKVLADLTVVTDESRSTLIGKLPKRDDQGYTAIGRGLLYGVDVLRNGADKAEGTRIILVTDGEENVGPRIDEVIPVLKTTGVQVMAVAFGVKATDKLERLAVETRGKVFFFPDLTGKKPSSELDSAFLESTTVLVSEEQQPIRIVEEGLSLNEDWIERSLLVEDALGKNLVITVTSSRIDDIELQLTDPNGRGIGPGNAYYLKDTGVLQRIRLEIPTAIQGTWKLSLSSRSGPATVDLSVLSHMRDFEPTQRPSMPIRIRAWLDDIQPQYPAAVRILAQVVKGGLNPVSDAVVTAVITRPNDKAVEIILKDNGAGADVTRGDGIYSGYFTQYTANGRYAVFVRMISYEDDSKNSGSSRNRRSLVKGSGQVERVADAGAFRLDNWSKRDAIPPSRVIDLRANIQNGRLDRIWLTWTSPGDDMDHGRASKMDIRVSHDPDVLRGNFTFCHVGNKWLAHNLTLAHGGEEQQVELSVPQAHADAMPHSRIYYFALRAIDKAGNTAEISNVASVTLVSDRPVNQPIQDEERQLLVPLVAGACGLLVLIALSGLILMIYTRRKEHKTKTHYFASVDDYGEKDSL